MKQLKKELEEHLDDINGFEKSKPLDQTEVSFMIGYKNAIDFVFKLIEKLENKNVN